MGMETIRVRREGYAHQEAHESFYYRFQILMQLEDTQKREGIDQLFRSLSKSLNTTKRDWQVGHSKVFLKQEFATKLETLVLVRTQHAARIIGRFGMMVVTARAVNLISAWTRFRTHMRKKCHERMM